MSNNKKDHNNKAEEPNTAYQARRIKKGITISSLSNLKELDRAHTRNLSPLQRMKYLRKLNKNVFGFDTSRQEAKLRKGKIIIRKES